LKASVRTISKNRLYSSGSSTSGAAGCRIYLKILTERDVELCCCELKAAEEKWKKQKQLAKSLRLNRAVASSLKSNGFQGSPLYAMDWNGT
jgi:hypothetical protein